jgi:hypothetical protein
MPQPIAICLEDLGAPEDGERYLRCVALPGRQPGLRLDASGAVLWQEGEGGCELWVSADQQLILFRPEGAAPAGVARAGRTLAVPVGKPVVLLGGDELELGGRRLRVHLHGEAGAIHAPAPLEPEGRRRGVKAVAAALALTASLGASDCRKPVEVRDQPPVIAVPPPKPDARPAPKPDAVPTPVEVRDHPPEPAVRPPPPKKPQKK